MSKKEIVRISFRTVAVYLILVNVFDLLDKLIFTYRYSYKLSISFNVPSIFMLVLGGIIWLAAGGIGAGKRDSIKRYFEFMITGLILVANGFYKFINVIWEELYFYMNIPNNMFNKINVSQNQSVLTVRHLEISHLFIYLIEIVTGLILFGVTYRLIRILLDKNVNNIP